ncbi:MAG: pseudouridine synthase [Rhodocyclaceae bacterium]
MTERKRADRNPVVPTTESEADARTPQAGRPKLSLPERTGAADEPRAERAGLRTRFKPNGLKPSRARSDAVRSDRAAAPAASDRSEEGAGRMRRQARPERSGRAERPERPERAERSGKPERSDRADRSDRPPRAERPARTERTERPARTERTERTASWSDAGRRAAGPRRQEGGKPLGRGARPSEEAAGDAWSGREARATKPLRPAKPSGAPRDVRATRDERPDPRPRREDVPPPRPSFASQPRQVRPADASTEGVRLSKIMAERGLCSRREADEIIERGWVFVDGLRVSELGIRVAPDADVVLAPEARARQASQVTILLHKPVGYVSGQPEPGYEPAVSLIGADNQFDQDTAQRFHLSHLRGLAPAGRLDIDSTGLLVLTQNGRIARQLIGDDSRVDKEYLVRVEGELADDGLALLNHGLSLDDRPLRPAKVEWANPDQLRFVLREGRKRQIRRMCELVGLKVTGLKRVRIGRVRLGDLPLGQWRYLREDERFD